MLILRFISDRLTRSLVQKNDINPETKNHEKHQNGRIFANKMQSRYNLQMQPLKLRIREENEQNLASIATMEANERNKKSSFLITKRTPFDQIERDDDNEILEFQDEDTML